jgi:ATP-dependent Lon protease
MFNVFQQHTSQSLVNTIGTAAVVVQVTGTNWPKPLYTLLVTGLCRFRIDSIIQEVPFIIANITQMDSPSKQGIFMIHIYKNDFKNIPFFPQD